MRKLILWALVAVVGVVVIVWIFVQSNVPIRPIRSTATPTVQEHTGVPGPTGIDTPPPTTRPQVIAVVMEITTCYSSEPEFQLSVSKYVDVGIFEKSKNGDLVQVQLNEKVDCWMPLSSLALNGRNLDALPIALVVPTLPDVTSAPELSTASLTPPSPLVVTWDMLSYDCGNSNRATGATIDLIVEGGVLDYRFSRNVPIYARPGEFLSITVSSNTVDGEPSRIIQFTLPEANDRNVYKCVGTGNVDDKENTSAPVEAICLDKRGEKVPCNPDRDPQK